MLSKSRTIYEFFKKKSFNTVAIYVTCANIGIGFNIYPLVESLWLSVHTTERGVMDFYGFKNYTRLLSDNVFYKSLYNSLIYLVIQVPIMLVLSTMLAVSVLNMGRVFFEHLFIFL